MECEGEIIILQCGENQAPRHEEYAQPIKMRTRDARLPYAQNDIHVTPEQVIVTTGGSESVLFSFLATLDPGDEVILPEPAYANYVAFSKIVGARIIGLPFRLPPIEEFEKRITPSTKAILICNPNNPTGAVYSAEELEKLSALVKRHDLFLFSDEVYREFCYADLPSASVAAAAGPGGGRGLDEYR